MEKTQLERILGVMLKSKQTPPQYKASLATSLSNLKGWSRSTHDESTRVSIDSTLRAWAREQVYIVNQAVAHARIGDDCIGGEDGLHMESGGGVPQPGAHTGALTPSPTTISPENSPLTVATSEVSECQTTEK